MKPLWARLFTAPETGDPERNRLSKLLYFTLNLFGLVMLPVLGIVVWRAELWSVDFLRAFVSVLAFLLVMIFSRQGWFHRSAIGLLLILVFFIATGTQTYGGLTSLSYVLGGAGLIVSAGLLYGANGAGIASVVMLILGLYFTFFPPALNREAPAPVFAYLLINLVFFFITGLIHYSSVLARHARDETLAALREKNLSLERLLATEWRFKLTLDGARLATWEYSLADKTLIWSQGAERIFGREIGPLPSRFSDLLRLIRQEDRPKVEQAFLEAEAGPDLPFLIETQLFWVDRGFFWVELRGHLFRDRGGESRSLMGTLVDTTERRQAQERLRESEERFRRMVTTLAAGVVEFDSGGRALHANPRALSLLGLTFAELSGEIPRPPSWRCLAENGEEITVLGERVRARLLEGGTPQGEVISIWNPMERDLTWILLHITAQTGRGGLGAMAHLADITSLRRTEAALKETQERWLEVVTRVPEEILLCDRSGRIQFFNRLEPALRQHVMGHLISDLAVPKDQALLRGTLDRVFERGLSLEIELGLKFHPTGATPCSARLSPVRRDGLVTAALIIASDLTHRRLAESALHEAEQRLGDFIRHSPAIVFIKDSAHRMVFASASLERLMEWPPDFWQGREDRDLFGVEVATALRENDKRVHETGEALQVEERLRTPLGPRDFLVSKFPLRRGTAVYLAGVGTDITERKAAAAGLYESGERLRGLFEQASVGIVESDLDGCILQSNRCFSQMLGLSQEDLRGRFLSEWFAPDKRGMEPAALEKLTTGESRSVEWEKKVGRPDGSALWVEASITLTRRADGAPQSRIFIVKDVTERKETLERLEYHAHFDPLTGIHNRQSLTTTLEERLAAGVPVALLTLDLLRFREINDTLGHGNGDRLLREVARRLKEFSLLHRGVLARLAGDEFAFLFEGPLLAQAAQIASEVAASLRQPIRLADLDLEMEVSMGLARAPEDASDAWSLLRTADVALHAARQKGIGLCRYESDLSRDSPRRLTLLSDLGAGIRNHELVLHFQPKIRFPGRTAAGFEVLVRWTHPRLGFISPAEFIPLAEIGNLIAPLTLEVLERSMAQWREWRDEGLHAHLAVNLSVKNLMDEKLPEQISGLLSRYGMDPAELELEITESAIMEDPARSEAVLERLAALGIRLSIDDFGTGHSTLSYLTRLPVHALKIDLSFVRQMKGSVRHAAVVASTVQLAHILGLQVVAEGVEDEETFRTLAHLNCDLAQGYLFSKPLPAGEIDPRIWLGAPA
jgi:diguanylate cyclase (GGDEF)-like protein/PAS domain S-box-containing protein